MDYCKKIFFFEISDFSWLHLLKCRLKENTFKPGVCKINHWFDIKTTIDS